MDLQQKPDSKLKVVSSNSDHEYKQCSHRQNSLTNTSQTSHGTKVQKQFSQQNRHQRWNNFDRGSVNNFKRQSLNNEQRIRAQYNDYDSSYNCVPNSQYKNYRSNAYKNEKLPKYQNTNWNRKRWEKPVVRCSDPSVNCTTDENLYNEDYNSGQKYISNSVEAQNYSSDEQYSNSECNADLAFSDPNIKISPNAESRTEINNDLNIELLLQRVSEDFIRSQAHTPEELLVQRIDHVYEESPMCKTFQRSSSSAENSIDICIAALKSVGNENNLCTNVLDKDIKDIAGKNSWNEDYAIRQENVSNSIEKQNSGTEYGTHLTVADSNVEVQVDKFNSEIKGTKNYQDTGLSLTEKYIESQANTGIENNNLSCKTWTEEFAISIQDSENSFEDDNLSSSSLLDQRHSLAIEELLKSRIEERKLSDKDWHQAIQVAGYLKNSLNDMKDCRVALYGSMSSGCALKGASADITVFNTRNSNFDPLEAVHSILKRSKAPFENVIKNLENKEITCNFNDITVRITKNRKCELQSSQWIRCYMDLDERVPILVLAFRCWREVCAEDDGTFHSLCYPLMVIHYLQQLKPPVLPVIQEEFPDIENYHQLEYIKWKSKNKMSVAELWITLFYFYGYEFNWEENVVTIKQSKTLTKQEKSWKHYLAAIEDPFAIKNSAGKDIISSQVLSYILGCFKKTHEYFMYPQHSTKPSSLGSDAGSKEGSCSLSDDEESEDGSYDFQFGSFCFTGGKLPPTFCSLCEKSGHPAEDCLSSVVLTIPSLPQMTDSFCRHLDLVCEQIREAAEISQKELKERMSIVLKLQNYLQLYFPQTITAELFGSSNNGFGLPDSDLDICLTFKNCNSQEYQVASPPMMLRKIAQFLKKSEEFRIHFPVLEARVPILKFHYKPTWKKGDISLSNPLALYNTRLLRTYANIDRRSQILGYCVKVFVKHCNLDVCSTTSLSSYGYILMVIHFLQQLQTPVLPVLQELVNPDTEKPEHFVNNWNVWFYDKLEDLPSVWPHYQKNTQSVGHLWFEFLNFCVEQFTSTENVISVRQKRPLTTSEKGWLSQLVCIEDPFNLNHNIGSKVSVSMAVKIKKAFINGRQLFGTPISSIPKGYASFRDFLFDPRIISKSTIIKDYRCYTCGLVGHKNKYCPKKRP